MSEIEKIPIRSGFAQLTVIVFTICVSAYITHPISMIGGTAGVAYIQSVFFRKIFKRYEPEEADLSETSDYIAEDN